MSNKDHVDVVAGGNSVIGNYRKDYPQERFDLSGETFNGFQLQEVDLSGSDCRAAIFTGMNCGQAVFDNADLREATFTKCNLSGARFQNTNLSGADLTGSSLGGATFHGADIAGANFSQCELSSADFSGANFDGTIFIRANLTNVVITCEQLSTSIITNANLAGLHLDGVDLRNHDLTETSFNSGKFVSSNFSGANLSAANLSGADISDSTLTDAKLHHTQLGSTKMDRADIRGADFFEALLDATSMNGVKGAGDARNLHTTHINSRDVRYFDTAFRAWPERWVDWERLRIAGRLPLFGASYTGLIIIPGYIYFLGIYNDKIGGLGEWVKATMAEPDGQPTRSASAILSHLHTEPIPSNFEMLFLSTLFLACASTIYTLFCPPRVKAFSRDQWCDELRHSLVHYWPFAWRSRSLRLICAALYLIGGLGALEVLISKLWFVFLVLLGWVPLSR